MHCVRPLAALHVWPSRRPAAVQAIAEFMEGEGAGRPPLSGFLPDMTASTAMFIRLQSAYKARADTEAASVRARMDALLVEAGLKPEDVPQGQFSTWVKAVQFADVIQCVLQRRARKPVVHPVSFPSALSQLPLHRG